MIHHVFDWNTSYEHGYEGWLARRQPDFDPVYEPYTMAHDAVEHWPARHGHEADELLALGALLRGRGMAGFFERPLDEILADEIQNLMEEGEYSRLKEPPSHLRALHDKEAEKVIHMAVERCRKTIVNWNEAVPEKTQAVNNLAPKFKAWLRLGYAKCGRRYHDASSGLITKLFVRVQEGAREFVRKGTEGDTLHLAIDPRALTCQFKHKSKEWSQ